MAIRVLTWNLYHGRDFPPDPALRTWRSRLLGCSERGATHLQVNRDLSAEFTGLLARASWDVALLQECPPRWCAQLERACAARTHRVLTSRNSLPALRALLARLNPDLIGANEGGSNLTLVRGEIAERRALELQPGPRAERRTMAFTRAVLDPGATELCVANLHLSMGRSLQAVAEAEALLAAERARAWAGGRPLVLGGDFNLRPRDSEIYAELEGRFGLAGTTAPEAIDHLLASGLEVVTPPHAWAPERREVQAGELAIRLSDHAPVEARFGHPRMQREDQPAVGGARECPGVK